MSFSIDALQAEDRTAHATIISDITAIQRSTGKYEKIPARFMDLYLSRAYGELADALGSDHSQYQFLIAEKLAARQRVLADFPDEPVSHFPDHADRLPMGYFMGADLYAIRDALDDQGREAHDSGDRDTSLKTQASYAEVLRLLSVMNMADYWGTSDRNIFDPAQRHEILTEKLTQAKMAMQMDPGWRSALSLARAYHQRADLLTLRDDGDDDAAMQRRLDRENDRIMAPRLGLTALKMYIFDDATREIPKTTRLQEIECIRRFFADDLKNPEQAAFIMTTGMSALANPAYISAYYQGSKFDPEAPPQTPEEIRSSLTTLTEKEPKNWLHWLVFSTYERDIANYEAASKCLSNARLINPHSPILAIHYATLHATNNPNEAVQAVLEADPPQAPALLSIWERCANHAAECGDSKAVLRYAFMMSLLRRIDVTDPLIAIQNIRSSKGLSNDAMRDMILRLTSHDVMPKIKGNHHGTLTPPSQ